ncbi:MULTISPECIES: PHP domain-containing protein [Streptomyces]|uniref:PHP domain-containing protein n=1 Tax=Streptomyces parvulus TaxID=146923 RepID=A0A191V356_9ACTN|nr:MULTISPECIES: PHP domain-containing protein [Streptomyces]ANJ09367.1 phosphatase [Streptomyces parvulus]MCQ4194275.1 PHP domain-containing protein [Streptomyces parvulus]WHM30935.1 PHP domain-containing protein [Streptomyces sp. BPPL-273]WML82408.1 PHP domain-containing protein [Streptomyces sp. VNUA74]GGR60213.1 phosphatase [Streptomyces parvulus]
MRIDLHTHSTASDGTDTPAQLVRKAATAGLDVVALTDHDTTRGHAEALAALPEGLTLVTGAELSCRLDGVSMHMLAYLFDPEEPAFLAERELVRDDRVPRARGMVARLNDLGVPVTWEQVARIAGDGSVGRPHVASALVEIGVVPTVGDAFTGDWLADGGRAFVPKHETDPFEALRLIKGAGGVAVFAHPAAVKRGRTVPESAIADLAAAGLDGIEIDHMDHDAGTRARLRGVADELGLLATGSSDYHGSRKTCVLGQYTTDPEVYGEITRRAFGAFPVPGAGGA